MYFGELLWEMLTNYLFSRLGEDVFDISDNKKDS